MASVVIVGSGLAGYTLAKEFRKIASEPSLHIITLDDGAFYSKPMLSNALAKGKTARTLVSADVEQMKVQLNATVWTHTAVEAIDIPDQIVTARGESLRFERLVLAIGAQQIRPPLTGNAVAKVCTVNSLADYANFRQHIEHARRIAIIGTGLIGCEFANDLMSAGKEVTVIGPAAEPLDRFLPSEPGKVFREALTAAGVNWRMGVSVQSVDHRNNEYLLQMSDETTTTVDAALSAVGLQPKLDLAQQAGIETERGIVVNRYLETSVPNVFALGDCAEVEGLVLPFVMPIMHAARALAKTLSGTRTAVSYPAMPVVVKTPAHPVVVSPPRPGSEGQWEVMVSEQGARALNRNAQGKLVGYALTGLYVTEKQALTKEITPWL